MSSALRALSLAALLALPVLPAAAATACDRACLSGIVDQVLASMPAHDPHRLPLAASYAATENSHPSALAFMTAWRSITQTGQAALKALDTRRGQAYFALPVSESGARTALWGRLKVVDREITELEIFLNRSRGDHGFSFSAEQMRQNYATWMNPPAKRQKTSREELEKLAAASFDARDPYQIDMGQNCQFSEVGALVIDPGLDDVPPQAGGPDPKAPLGCMFPPFRPTDLKARTLVVDEETGIVVTAAMIPGVVYPYPWQGRLVSAFIPDDMKDAQKTQDDWIARQRQKGRKGLLAPSPASGEAIQVFQLYDGKMQGSQINVYLNGPQARSAWVR